MGNYCCGEDDESPKEQSTKRTIAKTSGIKMANHTEPENKQQASVSEKAISKHGPDNYQSIKYLGRGTFGDVVLTEDKESSKQYAMKIIDKSKIKEVNVLQCKLIREISDKDILVTIRETFQNENKIYIIMEYLSKGDIYFYLKKKEVVFTQAIVRDVVAEIIYGVSVLHSYGIIYRELKPQNILVANDGHIKLTDYGLSKMIIEDKNSFSTFVGALEYMAPEMLKGKYDKKIDLWAIGILMFELRFERNPFLNQLKPHLADNIIQQNIEKTNIQEILNEHIAMISQEFRELLIGLLQKNPDKRFCLEQVKHHPFFREVDWADVAARRNTPPLKEFVESNDHIKFRDPMNESEIVRRYIRNAAGKEDYKANLYEFRTSN